MNPALGKESHLYKHGYGSHRVGLCRTYRIWRAMKRRCASDLEPHFSKYKGRGIAICKRWLASYPAFLYDMGECPTGMQLDRKDNNKGYYKRNCRWATPQSNARNRRSTLVCHYGNAVLPVIEVANIIGVKYSTLRKRLQHAPHLLSRMFSRLRNGEWAAHQSEVTV